MIVITIVEMYRVSLIHDFRDIIVGVKVTDPVDHMHKHEIKKKMTRSCYLKSSDTLYNV